MKKLNTMFLTVAIVLSSSAFANPADIGAMLETSLLRMEQSSNAADAAADSAADAADYAAAAGRLVRSAANSAADAADSAAAAESALEEMITDIGATVAANELALTIDETAIAYLHGAVAQQAVSVNVAFTQTAQTAADAEEAAMAAHIAVAEVAATAADTARTVEILVAAGLEQTRVNAVTDVEVATAIEALEGAVANAGAHASTIARNIGVVTADLDSRVTALETATDEPLVVQFVINNPNAGALATTVELLGHAQEAQTRVLTATDVELATGVEALIATVTTNAVDTSSNTDAISALEDNVVSVVQILLASQNDADASLTAANAALDSRVVDVEGSIDSLEGDVVVIESTLINHDARIDSNSSSIIAIDNTLADHEQRIAELEAELAALKAKAPKEPELVTKLFTQENGEIVQATYSKDTGNLVDEPRLLHFFEFSTPIYPEDAVVWKWDEELGESVLMKRSDFETTKTTGNVYNFDKKL